jgi:protein-disulfide isomerase
VRNCLLVLVVLVSFAACSGRKGSDSASDKEVIAQLNGEKITLADLGKKYEELKRQIFELKEQDYKFKSMYLNNYLEEKLIELEAKKRNISIQELVEAEFRSKVKPVTDQDVLSFAKEKGLSNEQVNQLKDRIKMLLQGQEENALRKEFAKSLKKTYNVKIYLAKPARAKVDIKIRDTDPVFGNKKAKVTIVEFSDFECPFCGRAAKTIEQLRKDFGEKIKVVFKQFPLSFHPNANRAAQASLCANDQGKFWEYHDKLFASQQALAENNLNAYAKELGLDVKKFTECLKTSKFKTMIDEDIAEGSKGGVSGTPAFFINGELHVGAIDVAALKDIIDDANSNE